MNRPKHLSSTHAARFKLKSVAELYEYRAPYSAEVFDKLLDLLPANYPIVLDAGCGPGKLARGMAPNIDRVDAVDFSAEMIRIGQQGPGGDHPNIFWQHAPIETAQLQPQYGLIVAGASLHWMEWETVLPKFKQHLVADGFLAIVSGDGPALAPWAPERRRLITEYSTNQDYVPFDLTAELSQHNLFEIVGRWQSHPLTFTQTIDDFLKGEHSRESLSIEMMGDKRANEFDVKFKAILEPYTSNGLISYPVSTKITWGKPL